MFALPDVKVTAMQVSIFEYVKMSVYYNIPIHLLSWLAVSVSHLS